MSYGEFEDNILALTGIDLTLYKRDQMERRIVAFMGRLGLDEFADYITLLRSDSGSLQRFLDHITINVTEFFRTPDEWRIMADKVISGLPDDAVIWSSACSTGEEPYSLAISIAERRPLANIRIIASDIDRAALEKAGRGEFGISAFCNAGAAIREKYFTVRDDKYTILDEIRSHVEFRHINLLSGPYPQDCDLIACRNVLIYFTSEAQDAVYQRISDSLRPGGYLFTGRVEQILGCSKFGLRREAKFLYQKEISL